MRVNCGSKQGRLTAVLRVMVPQSILTGGGRTNADEGQ